MADPFSVAGSAVGVISLAIQAAQTIVKYYGSWKDRKNNIAKMLASTESLVKMLKLLRTIIEEEVFEDDIREMVEESIQNCASAVGQLNIELAKVRKVKTDSRVDRFHEQTMGLLYPFRESTLLKLQQIIAEMRENLVLAIEIIQVHTTSVTSQQLKDVTAQMDQVGAGVASVGGDIEQMKAKKMEEENQAILDWMSPLNFWSAQIDIFSRRQEGTGEWLFENPEFNSWISQEISLLWCHGPPGAGKSVLASSVIEFLRSKTVGASVGLAHIYCNHKDQGSQTVSELVASIVQQLSRQQRSVPEDVKQLYLLHRPSRTRPILQEWLQVLRSIVTQFRSVYLVIDALDECIEADGTRRIFIQELQRISELRILCTSRYLGDISKIMRGVAEFTVRATDADIAKFLQSQILKERDLMEFCERDPSLFDDIVDKVVKQADGMFLLAQLHIQSIARKITLKRVRLALNHLPERLDDLYNEAIGRIQTQDRERSELAHRLLCWITYAFEPLHVNTVQHALLAMTLGSDLGGVDPEDCPAPDLLITICAGLVIIDEESKIIKLVHHTTQEYFDRNRQVLFPEAQTNITQACIKYLLQPVFAEGPCASRGELNARKEQYPFFLYASQHWGNHARGNPESESGYLISTLLLNELSLASVVQGMIHDAYISDYSYHDYTAADLRIIPVISVAASFGLLTIVETLLEKGADIMERGSDGSTALHYAAWGGHLGVLKVLISKNADVNATAIVMNVGQSVLQGAASKGYAPIIRMLLEHGAEIEFRDGNGRTALHHAAQNGWDEATRELLRFGADSTVKDRVGETPLSKAVARNHTEVMKTLSGHWTESLAATRQSCLLLQYAASSEDDSVFEKFMLKLTGNTRLLKERGETSQSAESIGKLLKGDKDAGSKFGI